MSTNAATVLIDTLVRWGVDTVFRMPGDGINGVMEAIRASAGRSEGKIRFVQVRHEESAAFMACAHAKFTEARLLPRDHRPRSDSQWKSSQRSWQKSRLLPAATVLLSEKAPRRLFQ